MAPDPTVCERFCLCLVWKVEGARGCSCTEVYPPLLETDVWVLWHVCD